MYIFYQWGILNKQCLSVIEIGYIGLAFNPCLNIVHSAYVSTRALIFKETSNWFTD